MEVKKDLDIESLEMYKKDLGKIRAAVFMKREKEILKLESKIKKIEELSEDELQEMFGFDVITKSQYQHRLDNLREYEKNKETFKDDPTVLSVYLQLLNKEIKNISLEIRLNKEEL